jgi:hypothetical protein
MEEDMIRRLIAEDTWRRVHGGGVPVPWDSKTGYDPYGLVGLSEQEMRRRTTTAEADRPHKHAARPPAQRR